MQAPFVNPHARFRLVRQGDEDQPVLVIDDVLADPTAWRDAAVAATYRQLGPYYPGPRAEIDEHVARTLCDELARPIGEAFGPPPPLLNCYFSLVTTPPGQLAPIQRLPHVDGLERDRLALLIYLSGAEHGGTAFYRQRATGYETVSAARFARFDAALRDGINRHGLPPAAYIAGDTPIYQQVAAFDARPNRALVYRSHALHCGNILPGTLLSPDPARGRLTINAFLFDPAADHG